MIIKVFPDKEKAESIFKLVLEREEILKKLKTANFPTIVAENYYEVIKEFSIAFLLLNGFKSTGENAHKDLFDFLFQKKVLNEKEYNLTQDLRIRRNQSSYEGKQIPKNYLENNEKDILELISKLRKLVKQRL